ncbi:mechanosensitive ion channel domain-containing protein [Acetobacter okinawensis]|uniref:mechanosensitive ion channel domain-containing protein n=1 Tax=Acetobacter okinawensis TaxID=1076594 RepID=UPI001BA8052E|nr:mechanosensitive ion channel domain-containing protein [Acetobacter okinawensis]MBS0989269.1 mechanosensitive ion channel [Acetobacter okinawensis]MCP1212907.1 mechanosensitive ion channel [Acetobacter okinawensis]
MTAHSRDRYFLFSWICKSCCVLLLGLGLMLPQSPAFADAQASAPAGGLSQQDAQQLLNVLNDPQKRAEFTKTLSLMAKGLPDAPKAATATAASPAVIDNSVHSELDDLGNTATEYVNNFTSLFKDLGSVASWFRHEVQNPQSRKSLLDSFGRALLIIALALVAERAASIGLRSPLTAVKKLAEAREARQTANQLQETPPQPSTDVDADTPADPDTTQTREKDQRRGNEVLRYLVRIPYNLMHFLLKLLPVGVCLLLGYLGAEFLTSTEQARTVALTLVNAYAIARGLYLVIETVLVPRSPAIRLVPMPDDTARLLTRWWNVLVAAPSIVICLSILGREFDLDTRGVEAMMRGVVLIEHLLIAAFIWRIRHIVARALQPSPGMRKNALGAFAGSLAKLWWVPIIFLDLALWFVWAAHLKGGYQWILHGTLLTFLCLIVSRVLALLVYGLQDHLFRVGPELQAQYPDLQKRADFYYPFVRKIMTIAIILTTAICIAQSWSIPTFDFFLHSALGLRLVGAAACLLVGMSIAAVAWETVNSILNKQISRYSASAQEARAARLRTVLPIIRTVLLTVIIIFVAVTTLSQIGINVTPLLTGAGILGVGLSFGSQSLVKDVITGFFMLAEDAIQVGDWVTTGGIAGTVEHLSIRTLRVRSFDGDLHIIPFSSVTSIANTARGFNQIIVRQTLDLSEDTGKVVKIMQKTIADMRKEDAFRAMIFSDYTDLGVDSSDGNGAVLVGIIKTAPMMKWKVQREFYRRIALSMAAAGVKFYTPTSYSTTPPGVPLHMALDAMPTPPQTEAETEADAPAQPSAPPAQPTSAPNRPQAPPPPSHA